VKTPFTEKQGQYLAFVYWYRKLNGRPPAAADMMVLTLEARGFIERVPGQARSIRLKVPREQLPDLL
jgi:repressor LexA